MMLAKYIKDLLYRYDCVIVPNFGGFITNRVGAKIYNDTIYPPNKQVSFNAQLAHNDGLLVNEYALANKISFEEAKKKVSEEVVKWKMFLEEETLHLEGIGSLVYNTDKQLVFEPNKEENLLTDSFGLNPIAISVLEEEKKIVPIVAEAPLAVNEILEKSENEESKKSFGFIKYAAAAAILVAGVIGVSKYNTNSQIDNLANEQNALEEKIQKATFIIDDQLPTINFNISKEHTHKIHIIAGAFQLEKNAIKKVNELKSNGFDAKILGKNNWGLTQVSVGSYTTKEEAKEVIEHIREKASSDAWILVK